MNFLSLTLFVLNVFCGNSAQTQSVSPTAWRIADPAPLATDVTLMEGYDRYLDDARFSLNPVRHA